MTETKKKPFEKIDWEPLLPKMNWEKSNRQLATETGFSPSAVASARTKFGTENPFASKTFTPQQRISYLYKRGNLNKYTSIADCAKGVKASVYEVQNFIKERDLVFRSSNVIKMKEMNFDLSNRDLSEIWDVKETILGSHRAKYGLYVRWAGGYDWTPKPEYRKAIEEEGMKAANFKPCYLVPIGNS